MIMGKLLQNPFDKPVKPWKPWYGYLFGIVAIVCFGLYIYQRMNGGPVVPTSTIPSQTYNQLIQKKSVAAIPPATAVANAEPSPASSSELTDIAKAALELLAAPPASKKVSENLLVPFTTQAPDAVWDDTHKTLQEEASLLMVMLYIDAVSDRIDPSIANAAFSAMIDTQTREGFGENLTVSELKTFAELYASIQFTVVDNPTVDHIKAYISAGRPILVPVVTEKMNNEFYLEDAAPYHYVVIRGYDGENFITNDPGTRHGENYLYAQTVIMEAMGDWNNGNPAAGAKSVLILDEKEL